MKKNSSFLGMNITHLFWMGVSENMTEALLALLVCFSCCCLYILSGEVKFDL